MAERMEGDVLKRVERNRLPPGPGTVAGTAFAPNGPDRTAPTAGPLGRRHVRRGRVERGHRPALLAMLVQSRRRRARLFSLMRLPGTAGDRKGGNGTTVTDGAHGVRAHIPPGLDVTDIWRTEAVRDATSDRISAGQRLAAQMGG